MCKCRQLDLPILRFGCFSLPYFAVDGFKHLDANDESMAAGDKAEKGLHSKGQKVCAKSARIQCGLSQFPFVPDHAKSQIIT